MSGIRLLEWGERAEAEAAWRRFDEVVELTNHTILANSLGNMIRIARATVDGRLDEAVAIRNRTITRAQELGTGLAGFEASSIFMRACIHLGNHGAAIDHFKLWDQLLGRPDPETPPIALLLVHSGRLGEAREALRLAQHDSSVGPLRGSTHLLCQRLETAVLLGDAAAAAAFAEPLRPLSGMLAIQGILTSVARLLGDCDALLGRGDAARAYYEQAIEVCEKVRFRPEIAVTRLNLAELLLKSYPLERPAAMEHLDFAIAEFEAMGMAPSLQRALRLRGRRPRAPEPKTDANLDGLSDREVGVLRLIAAGRSNQEIADDLVISLNTVRRHVSNIFVKANLRNRAEAAVYAQRHLLRED